MPKVCFLYLFLFAIAVCTSNVAHAQNDTMERKQIGLSFGGSNSDRGIHVKKTTDGGLLIVGLSASFSESNDVYVVKTDLSGNNLWEKHFGGNNDDFGWAMEETDRGEKYLIAGFSDSYSKDEEDIILLKITRSGELDWIKNLQNPGNERCWSMKKLLDGNFLLIGQTQDLISRDMDGLVTKIDADGNILWQRQYGGVTYDRLFYGTETVNNDLLLAGITRRDSSADNTGWVLLIDKDGQQKESKHLNSMKNITTHGVLPISKQKILIYGYAQVDTAKDQRAIYMALFDTKGNMIWEKTTDERNSVNHGISAIQTSTGSILMTGYTRPLYSGNWNGVIYKFTNDGKLEWRREFGGMESDQPYTITDVSKDCFVITGLTKSFGSGKEDVWLVKINEEGMILKWNENN